jgi:hypothetical protein
MGWKDLTGPAILAAMDQMDEGLDEVWRQEYGFRPAASYVVCHMDPSQGIVGGAEIVIRGGYDHRTLLSMPTDFQTGPDLLPARDVLERKLGGICPGTYFSPA